LESDSPGLLASLLPADALAVVAAAEVAVVFHAHRAHRARRVHRARRADAPETMKSILFIVPRIPHWDQNAGDWRIYTLCTMLSRRQEHKIYIVALQYRWDSGKYVKALSEIGVKVLFPGEEGMYDFPQVLNKYQFDTVVFEWFYSAEHFLQYLPLIKNVIVDTHELQYVKAWRKERISPYDRKSIIRHNERFELGIYRMANTIIAISDEERAILEKKFPQKNILVLPTGVTPPRGALSDFSHRKDIAFLASFYRSEMNPNPDAVDYFVKEVMPLIRETAPHIVFHVLGYKAGKLRHATITKKDHIADIQEELGKYRVFVCPLRYGAGVKKKILDAAISKTPIVTTSVGIEGIDLIDGDDVFIADDPAIFAQKVLLLYHDEALWRRMAENAYAKITQRYGLDAIEASIDEMQVFQ
jgi:glycosyltransferase involved in cell wall biosynthesis